MNTKQVQRTLEKVRAVSLVVAFALTAFAVATPTASAHDCKTSEGGSNCDPDDCSGEGYHKHVQERRLKPDKYCEATNPTPGGEICVGPICVKTQEAAL